MKDNAKNLSQPTWAHKGKAQFNYFNLKFYFNLISFHDKVTHLVDQGSQLM